MRVTRRIHALAIPAALISIGVTLLVSCVSKAQSTADEVARTVVLRDLVMELQEEADGMGGSVRVSRAQLLDKLRDIVEHPKSRAELSTGERIRYELVWDGHPIERSALETVVLVREAAPASDGRRGVVFADGSVAFLRQ